MTQDLMKEAIERVQRMRDDEEREALAWYLGRFTDVDPDGLSIDALRAAFEEDDWKGWETSGSEDIEIWERKEGATDAFDRVLDVLQALAHGVEPAQGMSA